MLSTTLDITVKPSLNFLNASLTFSLITSRLDITTPNKRRDTNFKILPPKFLNNPVLFELLFIFCTDPSKGELFFSIFASFIFCFLFLIIDFFKNFLFFTVFLKSLCDSERILLRFIAVILSCSASFML